MGGEQAKLTIDSKVVPLLWPFSLASIVLHFPGLLVWHFPQAKMFTSEKENKVRSKARIISLLMEEIKPHLAACSSGVIQSTLSLWFTVTWKQRSGLGTTFCSHQWYKQWLRQPREITPWRFWEVRVSHGTPTRTMGAAHLSSFMLWRIGALCLFGTKY